jgi:hypothetical protein
VEGSRRGLTFKVVSRNFPGRTEKNHEKSHSGYPVSGPRYKSESPEYKACASPGRGSSPVRVMT